MNISHLLIQLLSIQNGIHGGIIPPSGTKGPEKSIFDQSAKNQVSFVYEIILSLEAIIKWRRCNL